MPSSDAVLPDQIVDHPDRERAWGAERRDPLADPASGASPELVERLAGLRTTVWSYVRRRRDAGAPVQRVLSEVRALVREALAWEGATGAWSDEVAEILTEPVVRWVIAAYHALPAEWRTDPSCDARPQLPH